MRWRIALAGRVFRPELPSGVGRVRVSGGVGCRVGLVRVRRVAFCAGGAGAGVSYAVREAPIDTVNGAVAVYAAAAAPGRFCAAAHAPGVSSGKCLSPLLSALKDYLPRLGAMAVSLRRLAQ